MYRDSYTKEKRTRMLEDQACPTWISGRIKTAANNQIYIPS